MPQFPHHTAVWPCYRQPLQGRLYQGVFPRSLPHPRAGEHFWTRYCPPPRHSAKRHGRIRPLLLPFQQSLVCSQPQLAIVCPTNHSLNAGACSRLCRDKGSRGCTKPRLCRATEGRSWGLNLCWGLATARGQSSQPAGCCCQLSGLPGSFATRAEDRVPPPGVCPASPPAKAPQQVPGRTPIPRGTAMAGPGNPGREHSRLKEVPDDEEEEGQGDGDVEVRGFGIHSPIAILQVGPGEICRKPEPFPPEVAVQGLKHAEGRKN